MNKNNKIYMLALSVITLSSIQASGSSLVSVESNNDFINKSHFNSVQDKVKSKLGSVYQNQYYDPTINSVVKDVKFLPTWTDYKVDDVMVGGLKKYQATYTLADGAIDKNVNTDIILNHMLVSYNENQITVLQDDIFPDPALLGSALGYVPELHTGAARSAKNIGPVVASVGGGYDLMFYEDSILQNKNLNHYPIYGCAKIGEPMKVVNKDGIEINQIAPIPNYGYIHDFENLGLAIDFQVFPTNPSYLNGLWNTAERFEITYFDSNDNLVSTSDWSNYIIFYAHAAKGSYLEFENDYNNNQPPLKSDTFIDNLCGSNIKPL